MRILFPLEPKAFRRFPQSAQRLGVMLLSAALKQNDFTVELVKAIPKNIEHALLKKEPTILAYSLVSNLAHEILEVNKKIKQSSPVKAFFGGPHPTYYPEMLKEDGVDGICLGEGEFALVDLANKIREGQDYTHLANWQIKKNGKIYNNKVRPPICDLDSIPFADRSIMGNKKINSVITSRGCPYKCTYCLNAAYNRLYNYSSAKIRQRSVDNVIEELKRIKKEFPDTFIVFLDTILAVEKSWTEDFSKKYKKYVDLPFFCNIKAEITDKDTVNLLKNAGCHSVGIGIESSNEIIRKKLMRRNVSNKQIRKVCGYIREFGIKMHTFNILGMPATTFADDVETLKFNNEIKSDFSTGSILNPYKKTEIYDMAKKLNMLNTDSNYSRRNYSFSTIDYGSEMTKRKLVNLESLYPILAKQPVMVKYVDYITKLPLTWLYSKFFGVFSLTVYKWKIFPPLWLRKLTGKD